MYKFPYQSIDQFGYLSVLQRCSEHERASELMVAAERSIERSSAATNSGLAQLRCAELIISLD